MTVLVATRKLPAITAMTRYALLGILVPRVPQMASSMNLQGWHLTRQATFLYVADTENDRIQVFEIISGTTCPSNTDEIIDGVCFVEEFGSSGSSDGRFNSPSGLAIDTDNDFLYVADKDNHRIQIMTTVGDNSLDALTFSDEFGANGSDDGEFNKPTDLAINNNEQLYVVDSLNNRIQMFELTSGDNCSSGNIEVVNDQVCFDEEFGISGSTTGRFDIPTDLAIHEDTGDVLRSGFRQQSRSEVPRRRRF